MSERKRPKQKAADKAKPSGVPAAASLASAGESNSPMNVELLDQIIRLMSANDLNTVDLRDGDRRVILKRGAVPVPYAALPPAGAYPAAPPQAGSGGGGGGAGANPTPSAESAESKLVPVKSPMVGTFYTAPKQGEKPYVAVGSPVNDDTDVCIIEAMKVFNVIKADTNGTVAKVLIGDGQPVEYGTVLFLVKPA